ncbi:beta-ketoacyl synthase chain length factor [Danxiaibacter flavus]|nr:beta-ketoacyl synthase chain length factor [Chitinophagaceae bacterium DXS]
MYIRSAAAISPQNTFGDQPLLADAVEYNNNLLKAIEPDYKTYIDAKLIRRMSRIIRMGVATASQCLQDAGVQQPSAIITGTAYGCLEDTGIFVSRMIEQEEQMLSPTAFIQSTHNTVGAQIALMLQCTNYNNTFVHGAFSFENALLDGVLLLKENEADTVLIGGMDELTKYSHDILKRFGLYKREDISNFGLFNVPTKGTIAGEGAAFFLLADQPSDRDYARLEALSIVYKPKNIEALKEEILRSLESQSVDLNEIDLIIDGRNGDIKNDAIYDEVQKTIFRNKPSLHFKHLCGEYPTAASFALWLAANILKAGEIPPTVANDKVKNIQPQKVLIYNHSQNIHHSVMVLSATDVKKNIH